MSRMGKARLQLLAAALLFSTGGPAIKASTLSPWQIACSRSAIAALVMLAFVPSARRALGPRSFVVGTAFGATMILYVLANRLTTAANAIFLQDTAPIYVMLLAPFLLGERVRWRDTVAMVVLGSGLALILFAGDPPSATAPDPARGNVLAAIAGVAWALTVIGLRWLARGSVGGSASDRKSADGAGRGHSAVVAGNLMAALVALPFAVPFVVAGKDLLIVSYLGAGQIALAYLFLTAGVRHISAIEASLLLLVEPVASAALGAWIHGEEPGPMTLVGAFLILLGTAARTLLDRSGGAEAEPAT